MLTLFLLGFFWGPELGGGRFRPLYNFWRAYWKVFKLFTIIVKHKRKNLGKNVFADVSTCSMTSYFVIIAQYLEILIFAHNGIKIQKCYTGIPFQWWIIGFLLVLCSFSQKKNKKNEVLFLAQPFPKKVIPKKYENFFGIFFFSKLCLSKC